jgi:hypothetical protein
MRAHPDQLCDHFVEFADYFCKGREEMQAYPYAVEAIKEKIENAMDYPYGIVYPAKHVVCSAECKYCKQVLMFYKCTRTGKTAPIGTKCFWFEKEKYD